MKAEAQSGNWKNEGREAEDWGESGMALSLCDKTISQPYIPAPTHANEIAETSSPDRPQRLHQQFVVPIIQRGKTPPSRASTADSADARF